MPKLHRHRKGKLVTGGHGSKVEGLADFLTQIITWPEVETVRLGAITSRRSGLRGVGGFVFKATRWAKNGDIVTGIKCYAMAGRSVQSVLLTSPKLGALQKRLEREGLCDNDWEPETASANNFGYEK